MESFGFWYKLVEDKDDKNPEFDLHVNFWFLGDILKGKVKNPYLDIGIKIQNYKNLSNLVFSFPFHVPQKNLVDLASKMSVKNNASIVFNEECEIETQKEYTLIKIPGKEKTDDKKLLIFPLEQAVENIYELTDYKEKSYITVKFDEFRTYLKNSGSDLERYSDIYIRFRIQNIDLENILYFDSEPFNKSLDSAFSGTRVLDFKINEKRNIDKNQGKNGLSFESLDILIAKWKDGTFSEIIDDWKWIFGYSVRYKWAIVFYTILGIFSTSMGLVSSVAGKYLIDIITGYKTNKLMILIIVMVGSSLFSLLFSSIISRISTKLSIYINNDIQADIFDKIVDADWLEINKYSNGDVLNRFNGDIGTVSSNAISWLPTIVIAIYNFIATFLVILHYNAVMAILALASAPFMLLMSRFMIKKQREYSQKTREMSSKLMTFEVEAFYNFDTIKSFGIAPHYSRLMRWWQGKFKDVSLEYNMFSIKTNILLSVMGTGVEFIAFGYCLFLLWTHTITYGTMTLFLQQRSNLSGAFNNVVSIIPSFLNSSVSAHRIRELVELPKEMHISESEELDPFAEDGFEVLMKDVNFAYVEGTRVITDSYFKACPGEIVALVGPSGEGKTTMIRLILGLIRPQEGEAVIVASNGREIVLNAETRHFFAYVPQGNTILSGTIAENMRMVKEDATDEEIIEALKIACAWEFVEKLPDTINSALGERGRGLSEGQAQRISIARAVLRNAPILLLDEATSALDVTTERKVLRNIIEQKPNKTCIVTTHRPSVLNMCQRVYRVMETKVTELDEEESSRMAMDF